MAHGNALGGDADGNGVRRAVVVAAVVADRVLDLAEFSDGHSGGAGDGLVAHLLQLEPHGVCARLGEAGQRSAVCAVLGGGVAHAHARGGHAQIN